MSRSIDVGVRLDAPHLDPRHRLNGVVRAYLERRAAPVAPVGPSPWPAAFFGLEKVGLFRDATAEQQAEIVKACAQNLLVEAYAIEKLGMASAAKMILVSETTEERMTFCHIAGDEASHLAWVTPFVARPEAVADNPFVGLMGGLVETASKHALFYLLQCVLEGWGLSHYRLLADGCVDPGLAAGLERILVDERLHHGTGSVLFDPRALRPEDQSVIAEAMAMVLTMVQVGPQGVAISLFRALGEQSLAHAEQVFTELDAQAESAKRLQLLRKLMLGRGVDGLVETLERQGLFTPFDAAGCAQATAAFLG